LPRNFKKVPFLLEKFNPIFGNPSTTSQGWVNKNHVGREYRPKFRGNSFFHSPKKVKRESVNMGETGEKKPFLAED